MFGRINRTETYQITEKQRCLDLIMSIVTNKISEIKKLVNESNVNNIIEYDTRMTALHYAAQSHYNGVDVEIEKYLLSIGANPNIKNRYNQDAYDISLKSNKRSLFDHGIKELKEENKTLTTTLGKRIREADDKSNLLSDKITLLNEKNTFLTKTCDNYKQSISELKDRNKKLESDIKSTNTENTNLKSQNYELRIESNAKDVKIAGLSITVDNFIVGNRK